MAVTVFSSFNHLIYELFAACSVVNAEAFSIKPMSRRQKSIEHSIKTTVICRSLCSVPGISQCPRCPQPSCHACVLPSADQQRQWPLAGRVFPTYRVFSNLAGREIWPRYIVLLKFVVVVCLFFFVCFVCVCVFVFCLIPSIQEMSKYIRCDAIWVEC